MKCYKGFNRDMTCRGFQYKEGETYHTKTISFCDKGFHACKYPLHCFSYYMPINSVFHEVALGRSAIFNNGGYDNDSKGCGKTIKIGKRLGYIDLANAAVDYIKKNINEDYKAECIQASTIRRYGDILANAESQGSAIGKDAYDITATTGTGSLSKTNATGCISASAGAVSASITMNDEGVAASAGSESVAINNGSYGMASVAGTSSIAVNTGIQGIAANTGFGGIAIADFFCNIAANTRAKSISDCLYGTSVAACTGDKSQAKTEGGGSISANVGGNSDAISSGDGSISASTGSRSNVVAAGECGVAVNTGFEGCAYAKGDGSIAIATNEGAVKGILGAAIVAAEYKTTIHEQDGIKCGKDTYRLIAVKAAIVDGVKIKADTPYILKNGEFVEVQKKEEEKEEQSDNTNNN